jgi:RHS repeat-associated protein
VFKPNGEVIGRSDYLPFGGTLTQSGALPRQRFTGQERDGEAGLDYFHARSMQARTGRMNAPDPLFGDAQTSPQRWNRYTYVMNNPLRMTDPSGMDMVDPNAAINQFYQDVWGTMAWDDFTNDYWAQGTGYSYGPFSPKEIAAAAGWGRNQDNGPTGEVWTGWEWSIDESASDAVSDMIDSAVGWFNPITAITDYIKEKAGPGKVVNNGNGSVTIKPENSVKPVPCPARTVCSADGVYDLNGNPIKVGDGNILIVFADGKWAGPFPTNIWGTTATDQGQHDPDWANAKGWELVPPFTSPVFPRPKKK